jgi:hypothetical protein
MYETINIWTAILSGVATIFSYEIAQTMILFLIAYNTYMIVRK